MRLRGVSYPLGGIRLEYNNIKRNRRNGGHITPNVYNDFSKLKTTHGLKVALQIIRFRLAHISALILAANDEHLLADSQARTVQEYDVYLNQDLFDESKGELHKFVKEAPEAADGFMVIEGRKAVEVDMLGLYFKPHTQPCICRTLDYLRPSWGAYQLQEPPYIRTDLSLAFSRTFYHGIPRSK